MAVGGGGRRQERRGSLDLGSSVPVPRNGNERRKMFTSGESLERRLFPSSSSCRRRGWLPLSVRLTRDNDAGAGTLALTRLKAT